MMKAMYNVTAAAVLLLATAAGAATYPNKPIRLIVPQQPGSSNDTVSRVLAQQLGEALGQQFVIDNRPGAGGIIGMELGARAVPDGYTLVATATAPQVIAPHLHKKISYDPFNDFIPISLYGVTYNALVTFPGLAVKNVTEMVALAKARPGRLLASNAGAGSQSHLACVMFALKAGIDFTHVPYKGGGAMVTAAIANEVQFTITPLPSTLPHIKSGRLRAIAVAARQRTPVAPDIPTFAESGFAGFESSGWNGLLAPRGTPKPIVDKLYATLQQLAARPALREQFSRQGAEVATSTQAEFARFIREEYDNFGRAVKAAGVRLE